MMMIKNYNIELSLLAQLYKEILYYQRDLTLAEVYGS